MALPLAAMVAGLGGCSGGSSMTGSMPAGVPVRSTRSIAVDATDLSVDATTNLIKNGSFETPVVADGSLDRYAAPQKIGAWTVVGAGTVDVLQTDFQYDGYTFKALGGKQQLDLTGASQDVTGVKQTIATTTGHVYTLSFFVGNVIDPNGGLGVSSTVDVSINGKQKFKATNSKANQMNTPLWQKFTYKLTASSTKTTIAFMNGDPPDDTYNGLDEVVLTF
ncbi:MAG: DUF642 domain-containing protein [Candidatus Eremiobacteraeota bacterium]|nr:DUF642 domain-containing protein [Candidatus Eremiobacteraeota bacterium]